MRQSYVEDFMREAMQSHTLDVEATGPNVRAWYLRSPRGGRMGSTLIVETREGLVIMGDRCPAQNGVISMLGYGADWFGGKLSEEYLCGKFLRRVFLWDKAVASARRAILELRKWQEISKDSARDAWSEITELGDDSRPYELYEIMRSAGAHDWGVDGDGMGYDPSEAGWLCAIQQRFAQLYSAAREAAA